MDKLKIWTNRLNELSEFVSKHDHMPRKRSVGIEKTLYHWIIYQKNRDHRGLLSETEKNLIISNCPGWKNAEYFRNLEFDKNFEFFKKFKTRNSRLPKPSQEAQENFLYGWMQYQKFKFKKNQLSETQIEALSQLFSLEYVPLEYHYATLDASWESQFEIFKEYFAETNKQPVEGLVINGAHIGTWANNNRILFRNGTLPEDRIERLKSSGFLFNPFMEFFKERLKELNSFVQANGRLPRYRDDKKLAKWASKNFKRFLEGKLSLEQYKLLKQKSFDLMFYASKSNNPGPLLPQIPKSAPLSLNDETIKLLLEDPNYEVSIDGSIWTLVNESGWIDSNNVWRRAGTTKKKFQTHVIEIHYGGVKLQAHRIVWAKYGSEPLRDDLVIIHLDGNGLNNNPENLKMTTQSEANSHSYKFRPAVIGNKKISKEIALEMRAAKKVGVSHKKLCEKYGVSKSTVSYAVNNRTWREEKEAA